jgi:aspartate beta-hydroxylase
MSEAMSVATTPEAQLRALLDTADRATAAGQPAQAERLLRDAHAAAPDHPQVLSALGMQLLRAGNASGARELIERALAVDAQQPMLWLNLALAHRGARDAAAEMAALERALVLDPYFFLALLQKATLLERLGKSKQAAGAYHAFLCCVPTSGTIPPAIQSAIAHARNSVAANNAELARFIDGELRDIRGRNEAAALERAEHCVDVLVGRKRVFVQQPTFMHFPRLPAIEFYDRAMFSWLDAVEAATNDIRAELMQLFAQSAPGFEPYVANPEGAPLNQWKELNHSLNWSAYYLRRESEPVADHIARCPKTMAALASVPGADVPGHGPTVFFSILKPKTRIPPHTGVTNTRLVVHLPLILPPACGFRVGSQTREWQVGRAWVFDDTIEHEAWNDSDEPRAILIFDIWNPYLTEIERDVVRAATAAAGRFNDGELPVGGL